LQAAALSGTFPPMRFLAPIAVLALTLAACADVSSNLGGEVTYAKDALGNYELGEKAFKSHSWTETDQYFQFTKSKFPYSRYAALAELRLADANFEQDKFVEAIDGYKNFIKDHPTHPKVDYASLQIAKAHFKDLPSGFFLFPPVYEKDQQALVDTEAAIKDFLLGYPASEYRADGQKMMAEVRKRLAEHEMYVARFYASRGYRKAAAWRYESVVKEFGDTPFADEAGRQARELYAKLPPDTRHYEQAAAPAN
jgi:outer membrane protein assembly factor BamD